MHGLHVTALRMPPILETAIGVAAGGAGVMAQPTSSGLPRSTVASEFVMSENVGLKPKASIESGAVVQAAQVKDIGKRLTIEEYLINRHQPVLHGRRRGRYLGTLRCYGRCIKYTESSGGTGGGTSGEERVNLSGATPVGLSNTVVRVAPHRTARSC